MRYFDYNATTPLLPEAREAWLAAHEAHWLNPSSPYRQAAAAKVRFDELRERLGELLGLDPARIIFNSGATEGNNAVFRHWERQLPAHARIAVSPIEHPSVLEPAKHYFRDRIEWLPLDREGCVDLDEFDFHSVAAVSLMAANNETGALQPWRAVSSACRGLDIPFHCDASQWLGKLAPEGLSDCEFVTGCAHKFGGPRGAGFLIVPESAELSGALLGGQQQSGRRAGTEDLAGAAAMVAALGVVEAKRLRCSVEGKQAFCRAVEARLPGVVFLSSPDRSLWNTASVVPPRFASSRWIRSLEKRGFLISAGSACSTGHAGPSHVLAAMGVGPGEADRVLRLSGGWDTPVDDWEALAESIAEVHEVLAREASDSGSQVISI